MDYDTLSETEWKRANRVWDLLDEGDVEGARARISALLRARPGHPDLRILDAAVALEEGRATQALTALDGAERSADPALFFHLRAAALFDLARFEEARDDGRRALAVRPDSAETHDLLARTLEHLDDAAAARDHAAAAHDLDPEEFPLPLEVSDAEFDRIVERCVREIPADVRRHLDERPVVVEALPSRELLTAEQPPLSPDLLGLFVGRHLLEATVADSGSLPGAIYLFRSNLLRMCGDREELVRQIRITVQHEIGHLLGLDEDDLERWGLA